jgi:hypothetical protein
MPPSATLPVVARQQRHPLQLPQEVARKRLVVKPNARKAMPPKDRTAAAAGASNVPEQLIMTRLSELRRVFLYEVLAETENAVTQKQRTCNPMARPRVSW